MYQRSVLEEKRPRDAGTEGRRCEDRQTRPEKRGPHEARDRDWSELCQPGAPRTAHNHQKLGKRRTGSPGASKETRPSPRLGFGLQASRTENEFPFFEATGWRYLVTAATMPCAYCPSLCILKPRASRFQGHGLPGAS